ncbi:hypothetical protein UFOVP276_238 [uncultured Caudovirales phage]|uniref:Uncharacterized protein n=1 Tax=uncultured Caudovirales phage TaxID=2100421 RepID=A0A6J5LNN2_9CAUD|nr:hypothetical protein UFOVP127_132 [uncultured Caudovirales phage]CAB4135282.1 hypothetical protein UFOVP276_238 [uncultured Caudovirales phage]
MEEPVTGVEPKGALINSGRVQDIFLDCMFKETELFMDMPKEGEAIMVEGVNHRVGFHPERLKGHREEVYQMLLGLPEGFKVGASFLEACNDRNGVMWTGMHLRMEQLFMLGIGLGVVLMPFPKALWPALPGGVPYFSVHVKKK